MTGFCRTQAEADEFFACLGEIWRDITVIEFLMRCAIARAEGDLNELPPPPYIRGCVFETYPRSFTIRWFSEVVREFKSKFPSFKNMTEELVALRNAMANGLIASIDGKQTEELVKFKYDSKKQKGLIVEFNLTMDIERLRSMRLTLSRLREHIGNEAHDR